MINGLSLKLYNCSRKNPDTEGAYLGMDYSGNIKVFSYQKWIGKRKPSWGPTDIVWWADLPVEMVDERDHK